MKKYSVFEDVEINRIISIFLTLCALQWVQYKNHELEAR